MRIWLVDTGPLVAYLDRGDPAHDSVARTLESFSGQLATTSAVLTEAMQIRGAGALVRDLVFAAVELANEPIRNQFRH